VVVTDPRGSVDLSNASDLADQGDRFSIRIILQYAESFSQICAWKNITAHANTKTLT